MNPAVARKGKSFKGVIAYITHDVGENSAERVEYVEAINLRTSDPEKAAKVMAWTATHAELLKQAAGMPATGRKTENPVYHYSLNWDGSEQVDNQEMIATAKASLEALGYQEHEAVLAIHNDKEHAHIHVVVNRVHPETGKTHNPDNDQRILQRFAYQHEKQRGHVVCLDRAIKYEKDPQLLAQYKARREAELSEGKSRDSKPRPQWEAEKDAEYPLSQSYQDIKQTFKVRVDELAKQGREAAQRRAAEWDTLKKKQAQDLGNFREKKNQSHKVRRAFAKTRGNTEQKYTWQQYKRDRNTLKKQHGKASQELKAQLKAKNQPAIDKLKTEQKNQWRQFFRIERAAARGQQESSVQIVANTPISQQDENYQGHLSNLFHLNASPLVNRQKFAAHLAEQRKQLMADIYKNNAPHIQDLKQQQSKDLKTLQEKLAKSKTADRDQNARFKANRVKDHRERMNFLHAQKQEREALTNKHAGEISQQRHAWANLNKDRSKAWETYKQRVAERVASNEKAQSRSQTKDNFQARATAGRDYGGRAESRGQDTSRGIERAPPKPR